MELISIIVPVYNVEKYLERCVESLLNQTYRNIEIILVDDGSKDNSGKICDGYAQKDSRIKVIHKENGGLSDARNKGIDAADGALIGFVDSDDYVSEMMYEVLAKCLSDTNADIAMCRYMRFSGECNKSQIDCGTGVTVIDTRKTLENIYNADGVKYTVAWNKLYKRKTIGNIRYPAGKINEDEFTTYKFIANAEKIALTEQILYYYYYNDNSITGRQGYLTNTDIYDAFDERIVYLKERGFGDMERLIQRQYLDRIIGRSRTLYKTDKNGADMLYRMYKARFAMTRNMVTGIGYRIYNISPALYYLILRVKNKHKK